MLESCAALLLEKEKITRREFEALFETPAGQLTADENTIEENLD